MNRLIHTPEGVQDLMGEALKKKQQVAACMMETFFSYGYTQIETPTFEFFDLFSSEIGTTPSNELYKINDTQGNTLCLRPDITPSIARVSAKYFLTENRDIRLCYKGNVFINHKSDQGRLKEKTQLGAEFIGKDGIGADTEILSMAITALKDAGLLRFRICLGHAEIFQSMIEAGNLTHIKPTLRRLIANKSYDSLLSCLKKENISDNLLLLCSQIFSTSVDTDWKQLLKSAKEFPKISKALSYLIQIKESLETSGLSSYVTIDPGMLSHYDYYTGIIFAGYAYGSGAAVLTGGRYDTLLAHFGKSAPAIGVAVLIDHCLNALEQQSNKQKDEYLTIALGKGRLAKQAIRMMEQIGISCDEIFDKETRKLIFVNEEKKIRFFLAKVPDVPTYVEYGAADIGIVGADTILEENRELYEVLDLGFGKCKMCVCGLPAAKELLNTKQQIRVGTKYPVIAKDYFFNEKLQTAEIIKLNGSIELAPILGLSDVIVDIVETGTTLKENGLVVLEEVCNLSARMVINQVSMQMEKERINEMIEALKTVR